MYSGQHRPKQTRGWLAMTTRERQYLVEEWGSFRIVCEELGSLLTCLLANLKQKHDDDNVCCFSTTSRSQHKNQAKKGHPAQTGAITKTKNGTALLCFSSAWVTEPPQPDLHNF
mmetsp:Transcript_15860/g.36431  ORF Transcript_15860/g.36431 Transcript_15860/m.36431 type:complete len:114 (+) Transcript_15860:1129-1470(+)